jgi:hypothetical protein
MLAQEALKLEAAIGTLPIMMCILHSLQMRPSRKALIFEPRLLLCVGTGAGTQAASSALSRLLQYAQEAPESEVGAPTYNTTFKALY